MQDDELKSTQAALSEEFLVCWLRHTFEPLHYFEALLPAVGAVIVTAAAAAETTCTLSSTQRRPSMPLPVSLEVRSELCQFHGPEDPSPGSLP